MSGDTGETATVTVGSYRFDRGQVETLGRELAQVGLLDVLEATDTTDIMVNHDGSVFVAGLGGLEMLEARIEPLAVESILASIAALHGLTVDRTRPILEATLPFRSARVQGSLPPIVPAPTLTLRVPPSRLMPLSELVERETLTPERASELAHAVCERETLVVAGGVGSGKTTLASALLAEVVTARPQERVITVEEGARELQIPGENVNRFLTDEASRVDCRRLLRHALRSNPDRIILGEARGPEALDFLKAANTGHPGGLLTVHANSAAQALTRLDSLAQEAGVPSQIERIHEAVDRVVYMERRGARRLVVEVLEVGGDDLQAPAHDPLDGQGETRGHPSRKATEWWAQ